MKKFSEIMIAVSVLATISPFVLASVGYGGEAFAQAGWVYSMMALSCILLFILLRAAAVSSLRLKEIRENKKRQVNIK